MINNIKKIYYHTNYLEKILFLLFAFFPISIVIGNLLINITFLLISVIFIINLILNKDFSFLKDTNFLLPAFFFISLLINVYFSTDPFHSYPRVIKILMMVLFVIQFKKILNTFTIDFEKIIFLAPHEVSHRSLCIISELNDTQTNAWRVSQKCKTGF